MNFCCCCKYVGGRLGSLCRRGGISWRGCTLLWRKGCRAVKDYVICAVMGGRQLCISSRVRVKKKKKNLTGTGLVSVSREQYS
jgi:hypothetical protein